MNINLKYADINAKLKGMHSKNLNDDKINELMKQNDLKSAIYFLKNNIEILKDIDENDNLQEAEIELEKITINDIYKIEMLLDSQEKEIFNLFISKYEIEIIMELLNHIINKSEINTNTISLWTSKIFRDIDGITMAQDEKQLLDYISNSIYFNDVKNFIDNTNRSFQMFNQVLYNKYFVNIYSKTKKEDKELNQLIGKRIDLLNILWIFKMKNIYYIDVEIIRSNLINIKYKLNNNIIEKFLKSTNINEYIDILKTTYYNKIITEENKYDIEHSVNESFYEQYKKSFNLSKYNFNTIVYYMLLQEIQMKNIINILGGINYNLDRNEIEKKIIL